MGRAVIEEGLGAGLYRIAIDYGGEIITQRVAAIQASVDTRQAELDDLAPQIQTKESAVNQARLAVDQAITDYQASIVSGEPLDTSGILAANAELINLNGELQQALLRQATLRAQVAALLADKVELENVRTTETRQAWCADFTVGAEGEVATLEIPGEPQDIIIVPDARPPTSADGRLIARGAQFGHQVYYNAAILPGWQKWMPTFRSGVITRLNGDRCDVTLDDAESGAQGLDVNQEMQLVDIPIEYMECNEQAFRVADHVVVNMTGEPNVVGFVKEPRPCCDWPIFPGTPDADAPLVLTFDDGFVRGWMKGQTFHSVRRGATKNEFPAPFEYDPDTRTLSASPVSSLTTNVTASVYIRIGENGFGFSGDVSAPAIIEFGGPIYGFSIDIDYSLSGLEISGPGRALLVLIFTRNKERTKRARYVVEVIDAFEENSRGEIFTGTDGPQRFKLDLRTDNLTLGPLDDLYTDLDGSGVIVRARLEGGAPEPGEEWEVVSIEMRAAASGVQEVQANFGCVTFLR